MRQALLLFVLLSTLTTNCFALEVYGHRGAAGLAPENTLPAYQTALDWGVDVIDMDVGLSKDGEVVVYHDWALNKDITRDEHGQWVSESVPIKQLNVASLKRFDVGATKQGSKTAKLFPHQKPYDGTQIPTLREVIQFTKTYNPQVRLQIEIKTTPNEPELSPSPERIVPAIVKVLREENISHLAEIHSYDWRNMLLLEKIAPEIDRSFITETEYTSDPNSDWTAGHRLSTEHDSYPKLIKALNGDIWCPIYTEVDQEAIDEAHSLGLKVVVWSVDKPRDMLKMIQYGVDGIITNRPDVLANILHTQKQTTYQSMIG